MDITFVFDIICVCALVDCLTCDAANATSSHIKSPCKFQSSCFESLWTCLRGKFPVRVCWLSFSVSQWQRESTYLPKNRALNCYRIYSIESWLKPPGFEGALINLTGYRAIYPTAPTKFKPPNRSSRILNSLFI